MLRLGLGPQIGTNTPADSGGEQVIWKVAIFGAGTTSSNGEYVWDGNELQDGKPIYRNDSNTISFGDFGGESAEWALYDDIAGDNTYLSPDLLNWTSNGYGTAPSSALSYAQDSFISSITLNSNNVEYPFSEDPFTRTLGGTAQFNGGVTEFGNAFIAFDPDPDPDQWYLSNGDEGLFASLDLITWDIPKAGGSSYPTVSAIVYSA